MVPRRYAVIAELDVPAGGDSLSGSWIATSRPPGNRAEAWPRMMLTTSTSTSSSGNG